MVVDQNLLRRRGFTLVELLLVVAIIAVLIGLLLPAVQKVREAASRCKCQSNLGNLTLATIHYEQVFGTFPEGYQSVASNGSGQKTGWGWMSAILPYLEQEPLQRSLRLDLSIADEANTPWRTHRIPMALCPSDPANESHEIVLPDPKTVEDPLLPLPTTKFACGQYVGVSGTTATDDISAKGILFRDSKVKSDEITDGLSNTMLLTERSSRLGISIWHGAIPGVSVGPPRLHDFAAPNEEPESNLLPSSALVLATTRGIPFLQMPGCPIDTIGAWHSGGVNVGFSDGHVSFLSASLPGSLISAWATRASGEANPAP
jgi:prepilin-type N-terminal cleavage/methylation domain-containing protein/prepilin-type processing-associated H-X9-DG protein